MAALVTAGVIVWACALISTRSGPTRSAASAPPSFAAAALLLVLIIGKDLIPRVDPPGADERRAALATTELTWPSNARNPALGDAAKQWAGLLIGGAAALALARATAGSARRGALVISAIAWLIAAFGLVVARNTRAGFAAAEAPGWIAASKNGAGALIAIGVVLHLGLALRAAGRSRLPQAALHATAAAALFSPLAALSSWTALIGLLVGGATLAAGSIKGDFRRAKPWLLAAAAGLGMVLAAAALQPTLVRRMAEFTGDYRFGIWRDTAALLRDSPLFGVGAGAFEEVYPLFGRLDIAFDARLSHPDSSWVLLAAEWGLLPLALLLWLLRRLLPPTRPSPGSERMEPAAIAQAGALGWLAAGITDITLHRPENFAAGVVLTGIMAGARLTGPRFRGEVGVTAAALGIGILLAVWSAGPGSRELRWGLLDPARLWAAALAGGETAATEPANLTRLRAAVKLQHRAVTYPFAVAKLVHPVAPEAAREFWRAAVMRAGEIGFDYLAQAEAAFPATPATYWLGLARETGPDNPLFVAGLSDAELNKELEIWAARPEATKALPPVARRFLQVAHRLKRADLVERVTARMEATDPGFWEETARLLLEAGRTKAAWRALERRLPPEEPATPGATRPFGTLEMLLAAGRFPDLRMWVLVASPEDAERALAKICAQEKAPAWFRLRYARRLAAAGDERGAVMEGLRGLAVQTGQH